jgi:hypothetical protein
MDSEKDLLKQDLNNQEKPEEIKKFIEDAELLGHEDIAELGRKKLQEILEKADNIEKTSETQVAQVESMGGTGAEVLERTKEVDQKIEEVKTQTQEKITEVENENQGEKTEDISDNESKNEVEALTSNNPIENQLAEQLKHKNNEEKKYQNNTINLLKKIKESPQFDVLTKRAEKIKELKKNLKEKAKDNKATDFDLQDLRKEERALDDLLMLEIGYSGGGEYSADSLILDTDRIVGVKEKRIEDLSNTETFKKDIEKKFTNFKSLKEGVVQRFGQEVGQSFDKYETYLSSGVSNINDYIKQKLGIISQASEEFEKERNDLIKTGAYYDKFLVNTNWTEEAVKRIPDFKTYKQGDYLS